MKVALTVWDGWISPVFDVCREAIVIEVEGDRVLASERVDLQCESPLEKIERLRSVGVESLICGAISEPVQSELSSRGLRVFGFVAGEIEAVLEAFILNRLPSPILAMPGCRERQMHINGKGKGCGEK